MTQLLLKGPAGLLIPLSGAPSSQGRSTVRSEYHLPGQASVTPASTWDHRLDLSPLLYLSASLVSLRLLCPRDPVMLPTGPTVVQASADLSFSSGVVQAQILPGERYAHWLAPSEASALAWASPGGILPPLYVRVSSAGGLAHEDLTIVLEALVRVK